MMRRCPAGANQKNLYFVDIGMSSWGTNSAHEKSEIPRAAMAASCQNYQTIFKQMWIYWLGSSPI